MEIFMTDTPASQYTAVLIHSNHFLDGSELVLAVGYAVSSKFGYFVTYLTNDNQYENTIKFIGAKVNDNSYKEILEVFKEVISLNK